METKLNNKINTLINETKAEFLSTKLLYKGKFINVIQEEYLLPNKKLIKKEKVIKNNGKEAVIIVAITKDNKFILVVQNRINNITSLEFPSGYIEKNETILKAALRELKEETGYVSKNITIIDKYQTSLGIDGSIVHIVIAYECENLYSQNLSKDEYIKYANFSLEEVKYMINNNIINSVGNKLAFYEFLQLKNS